jgi:hypothetical protein
MREFKSTDETLNAVYANICVLGETDKHKRVYVTGVLNGALIYSYSIGKISHNEFIALLEAIKESTI